VTWFIDNPSRFIQEKAAIEKLAIEVDWLSHVWKFNSGSIELDFDMSIYDQTFAGTLTYPSIFPVTPAFITPRDSKEQWSNHQYGSGGSLCLEWRSDNWRQEISGVDLIKSARNLLLAEKQPSAPSTVPSDHLLTQGQDLRNKWERFVITNGLITQGNNYKLPNKRAIKTLSNFKNDSLVMFVCAVSDSEGTMQNISDIPAGMTDKFTFNLIANEGYWYQHEIFDNDHEITSTKDLKSLLTMGGFSTEDIIVRNNDTNRYASRVIIIQGADKHSFRIFQIPAIEELKLNEIKLISPSPEGSRLPENVKQLENIKVGIVGLGSIGSKVAISLVRSGIKNFLLIDDDYLEIGNLVRHELSFTDVGRNKVDAVASAMNLISSELKITTNTTRIYGQESSIKMASCLKDVTTCDILIDATANPDVFLILASLAERQKIPLYWAEVFTGGCGGIIARAHPKFDSNPFAIRDGFHKYLMDLPPAPFKQATDYDDTDGEPIVAFDSDVTFIASALTRLIIDGIDVETPNKFSYPIYLIGMSKEWDFVEPFDTRPIEIDVESWSNTSKASTVEDMVAVLSTIQAMAIRD